MKLKHPKVVLSFQVVKDAKGNVLNPEVLSKTNQSEIGAVDINRIMKNHQEHGGFIGNPMRTPLEGDFTQFGDYREIATRQAQAKQIYQAQDVEVRNKFNNDPQEFFEFLSDSKNDEEAVKLGLKKHEVLLTHLDDDGKTRITKKAREHLDKLKADKAAKEAAAAAAAAAGQA